MWYKKYMTIYFAGSIRGGRQDSGIYAEIIQLLGRYGTVRTEHIGDANLTASGEQLNESDIFTRDLGWVIESDVMVAEVSTPSLGVGYEIGVASYAQHKPVLCLFRAEEGRSLSAMIAGNPNVMNKKYTLTEDLPAVFDAFFRHVKQNG